MNTNPRQDPAAKVFAKAFLAALNGEGPYSDVGRDKMRELVEDWLKHGLDHQRMSPDLDEELKVAAPDVHLSWNHRVSREPGNPLFRAPLVRTPVARSQRQHRLLWGAYVPFFHLVESPFRNALEPCQREGCDRYFLRGIRLDDRKGRGNARYCSKRCGHLRAALESTRKARRRAKEAKLARLAQARRRMRRLRRQPKDKKAWLARHAGVSKTFITWNRPATSSR